MTDKPIPVVRDGKGNLCRTYAIEDWFAKIAEEVFEAHFAAVKLENRPKADPWILAEELTDVITVCASYLHALGYDEEARGEIQRKVNEKNARRGYLGDGK